MTIAELEEQKERLTKLRDKQRTDEDKNAIQMQINAIEDQIMSLQHEENSKTTGQKIGGFIGKIISGTASMVVGEVDACITGKTNESDVKRTRAKVVATGDKVGSTIGGFLEKGIKCIRDGRKR